MREIWELDVGMRQSPLMYLRANCKDRMYIIMSSSSLIVQFDRIYQDLLV